MARLREVVRERGWAATVLEWRPMTGLQIMSDWPERARRGVVDVAPTAEVLTAETSRLRYFIRWWGREVQAWCETPDLGGARRYAVGVGVFADIERAKAACEADARARLQREPDDAPVDVRIAQPRRRR
jgi:hypothetical protein